MSKVEINQKKCKGCQLCIEVCPVNILNMSSEFNSLGYNFAKVVDEDKCISCARCAQICPDVLIEVYKEKIEK